MRKFILIGLMALALPALAFAGATMTQGNDTLRIRASFDPARASKADGPLRPLALKYHYRAGTTNDTRLPDLRSVKVYFGGAKLAFDAFKKCAESKARSQGRAGCRNGSRVGRGKGVAEIHPENDRNAKSEVAVDLTVFNGKVKSNDGLRDGLIIYTEVGGTRIVIPMVGERRGRQVTLYNPDQDEDPRSERLVAVKELHLTLPRRTAQRNGRAIPFVGAPRRCGGDWTVTTTNDRYRGGELTATHAVACAKP